MARKQGYGLTHAVTVRGKASQKSSGSSTKGEKSPKGNKK